MDTNKIDPTPVGERMRLNLPKISQYCICSYSNPNEIVDEVLHMINDGWVPYGGVSVSFYAENPLYTQAMVKYERNGTN